MQEGLQVRLALQKVSPVVGLGDVNDHFEADEADENHFEAVHDENASAKAHEDATTKASKADKVYPAAYEATGRCETSCPAKGRITCYLL